MVLRILTHLCYSIFLTILFCANCEAFDAQPIVKNGSCPFGYRQSGNYCIPYQSNSNAVVEKFGSCPWGFHQSGNYCLANKSDTEKPILKMGSCPYGYHQSGNYCIKN
jgi:hypothetical protein